MTTQNWMSSNSYSDRFYSALYGLYIKMKLEISKLKELILNYIVKVCAFTSMFAAAGHRVRQKHKAEMTKLMYVIPFLVVSIKQNKSHRRLKHT